MTEMVQIRSVKQYVNDFMAGQDLSNSMVRSRVKLQILDHFRQELFGQLTMKYGADILTKPMDEWNGMEGVRNILTQLFRKWRRLCILTSDSGIVGWLQLEDLQKILDEDAEAEKMDKPNLHEGIETNSEVVTSGYIQGEGDEETVVDIEGETERRDV